AVIFRANFPREIDFLRNASEYSKDEDDPVSLLNFRPSKLGLIPYVAIDLTKTTGVHAGRLPLTEVVLGPSSNPNLALDSLMLYMEARGYDEDKTSIQTSGIPLRR
ncbi:hypothetical protein, partial [Arthrobacter agilis]|uniref:hypothetical protein n=1 Tax=Arthrobacter agilis TaxID=37921 RepID=UPI001ABF2E49